MGKYQIVLAVSIIVIATLIRLLPHPPNVTPIAAMALFGGCYLDKRLAVILPLGAMLVSDAFLGFHQSMPVIYGSFIITCVLGVLLQKRKTVGNVILFSLFSSVLFFFITNFNAWLPYNLYPKTIEGQITAYQMALPFFRNSLIGDLLYTGLFFGGYELVLQLFTRKVVSKN